MVERSLTSVDERLGTARLARTTLRQVFPDHSGCRGKLLGGKPVQHLE